jgi:uncharacterized membrane protein YqaE (UPF0057 family)
MIKIKTVVAILVILSIGLTSCSKQYNLALVKNNYHANDVVQNEKSQPLKKFDQKKINVVNESNDMELVKTKRLIQTPVIVNETIDVIVTSSVAKDETGIDKNLFNEDSKFKSYLPVFSTEFNNQSSGSNHESDHGDLILYVILAILIPPLAVYLYQGSITSDFWIDLILTLCFDLPGIIFALYIILR